MSNHIFKSYYEPGDTVIVGNDIEGIVTRVSFTFGRSTPIYTVEWFNSGTLQTGEFYSIQLKDKSK